MSEEFLRTVNFHRPDAFLVLRGLANGQRSKLAKLMKTGQRVGRMFPEGIILASYVLWLYQNPRGTSISFLSQKARKQYSRPQTTIKSLKAVHPAQLFVCTFFIHSHFPKSLLHLQG